MSQGWRFEAYALHAGLGGHRRRVERALADIREALNRMTNPYVGWSGGKDSTVTLDLVRRVKPDVVAVHVRGGFDFPDHERFVDEQWSRVQPAFMFCSDRDPWEVLHQVGGPFARGRVTERLCFFEPLRKGIAEHGLDGCFLGLRAEESGGRRANRRIRGKLYRNKGWDMWFSTPVADWPARDVLAYLVSRGLPLSPIYRRRGSPETLREGWWVPSPAKCPHLGFAVWLRREYPDLWQRLAAEFPEVRTLV